VLYTASSVGPRRYDIRIHSPKGSAERQHPFFLSRLISVITFSRCSVSLDPGNVKYAMDIAHSPRWIGLRLLLPACLPDDFRILLLSKHHLSSHARDKLPIGWVRSVFRTVLVNGTRQIFIIIFTSFKFSCFEASSGRWPIPQTACCRSELP
jgi:hypothetical protein